ncbi:NUDIX hydrolase [Pelagovum pacificum]|uniref:NUDIX hydrolase n=1 Tax=Pelagovum pacificum TaxID=2588711 RepID=A0A5C5G8I3_9RHOB|nr:NUDIX hydrolase [Pelagovum pacificum]QQA41582.1 NUDIX hydrolase [Pelagovum pacificum]TNY30861.1 NUDIX hydrolase [Pelagovum pacificum]
MTIQAPFQRPLRLAGARKAEVRTQFALLGWRRVEGKLKVCLVTSRGSKRWILPKGWPMGRTTPSRAAAIEAWEEAGLEGKVEAQPLGLVSYQKRFGKSEVPVIAVVYAMEVTRVADDYPEKGQRKRKWFSPKKAASKLDDAELAHIVRHFTV